jgi:hypothetical protein
LNIIIRIEYILLKFHWGMKALIELHFQHEFIENVLRSTLSYPNETLKECIQFLNSRYKDVPLAIRILFLELQYIHTLDVVWKTLI